MDTTKLDRFAWNFTREGLSTQVANLFTSYSEKGLWPSKFFMNSNDYATVRRFGAGILELSVQAELLKEGLMGFFFGAKIYTSPEVEPGFYYVETEPSIPRNVDPFYDLVAEKLHYERRERREEE